MTSDVAPGIALLVFYAVAFVAMAVHPPLRRRVFAIMLRWLIEARRIYLEAPLRLVTGRHHPNHARIAQLEQDLGMKP